MPVATTFSPFSHWRLCQCRRQRFGDRGRTWVYAPERAIMHLRFSLTSDGIDVDWCGTRRHYRRLPEGASGRDIAGTYANSVLGWMRA